MDSLMARQFQLKAVWDDYADKYYERIHAFEKKAGRLMTPYEIHTKCHIKDHGDISESVQDRLRPVLWAIYREKERDMYEIAKSGEIFDLVTLNHWVDDTVKSQKVDFSGIKKDGVFNRVTNAYHQAQQEAAPN